MRTFLARYQVHIAWALLGLLLTLGVATATAPLAHYHGTLADRIERQYRTLGKLQSINERRGATNERAREVRERLFGTYLFSDVSSPEELALKIRKLIDALAAQHDLRLTSVDGVSPRRNGELVHAGVRVRAAASTDAVREILRELELHRPLLFIDRLSLSAARSQRARARRVAETQTLNLDMEISGYFLETGEAAQ